MAQADEEPGRPAARQAERPVDYRARIIGLLLQPTREWSKIAAERRSSTELWVRWVVPMSLVPAGSILLGLLAVAAEAGGALFSRFLLQALVIFCISLATVALLSLAVHGAFALGRMPRSYDQSFATTAHSFAPLWVSGVVLAFAPGQVMTWAVAGFAYGVFLLHRGLAVVMRAPANTLLPVTAALAFAWLCAFSTARWCVPLMLGAR